MPTFDEDKLKAIQTGFLRATRGETEEERKKREEEEKLKAQREALQRIRQTS